MLWIPPTTNLVENAADAARDRCRGILWSHRIVSYLCLLTDTSCRRSLKEIPPSFRLFNPGVTFGEGMSSLRCNTLSGPEMGDQHLHMHTHWLSTTASQA